MAKSFLTSINLNNNSLLNGRVDARWASTPTGTTNPDGTGTAVAGQISSYNGGLYVYTGSAWSALSTTSGTVSSVSGTSGSVTVTNGSSTPVISLSTAYGDSVNPYGTKTANYVLAAPNGSNGAPSFRALVAADIPTLNQNTTGSAATLTTSRNINGVAFNGSADITITAAAGTLSGATLASGVTASSLTSVGSLNGLTIAATQTVSMGGNKITNVGTPTSDSDAATKLYVDSTAQGIDWKASVRAATTANGTLATAYANGSVIDGVTLATGNRILIKNQTTGSENGIYTVNATGAPTRSTDADASAEIAASFAVFVEEGTDNADCGFVLTNNGTVTVGTTSLVFTQFTGLGQVTAGTGLTKTGNTLNAVGTADRITANADSIDIASTYAGQSTITTLGTVATGTWNGTAIAGQYGGTGVANTGKTITLGGNLTTSGAHATTLTTTGTTSVTLPTSGTLVNTAVATLSSLTSVGTIGTGVWQGTAVGLLYGGTGATTAATARANLGATTKVTLAGTGSGTTIALTHGLGTNLVTAQVYDTSTSTATLVEVDITVTSTVATATFAATTTLSDYTLVVVG